MRFQRLCCLAALTALAGASLAAADEKLDKIEKEVIAKWKDVKSMAGKMTVNMNANQGGMKITNNMNATIEYMRKGDKFMSRLEGAMKRSMQMGENAEPQTMDTPILAVSDGEFTHTLIEQGGQKMCFKNKTDAKETAGEMMIKALREQNEIVVKPDEELDGEACWVLAATPKVRQNPAEPAKTDYYLRQKDAALVKLVGYNADGDTLMTMTTADIKFNDKIDPAHFEFKVPEGVQVMDMTGGASAPAAPASKPGGDEKP
jgi:outer membrane lipoprotein-sorting protein